MISLPLFKIIFRLRLFLINLMQLWLLWCLRLRDLSPWPRLGLLVCVILFTKWFIRSLWQGFVLVWQGFVLVWLSLLVWIKWALCQEDILLIILLFPKKCFTNSRPPKAKKGFIAWKVDLSKAYVHLSWSFIKEVLWKIGIRGRILELLMHCISSASYNVILNGEVTIGFSPQCGINQDDPFYHYLLCMEKLSHIIQQSTRDKVWKPVQICQGCAAICHLFFADDLIFFGVSINQALVMKQCLDDFCTLYG